MNSHSQQGSPVAIHFISLYSPSLLPVMVSPIKLYLVAAV